MVYTPIDSKTAPQLKDVIVSITDKPFTSAPPLSFLSAYKETVTASSVYYDPLNPGLSQAAPVRYSISRQINTLSDHPLKLRHNGDSIDMELYVDTYNFVQKEPIIAQFSPHPILPNIRQGDRYQRLTSAYIYAKIAVPKASSKVWDGRYRKCVDAEGNEVSSDSRLLDLRAQVKALLEGSNQTPLSVVGAGGDGYTVNPPSIDPYATEYKLGLEAFIVQNYNSLSLSPVPKGAVGDMMRLFRPAPDPSQGTGNFLLEESCVAAVLDGPYFVRWIDYYVYTEELKPVDTSHLQDGYTLLYGHEQDGDEIVSTSPLAPSTSN